MTKYEFLGDLCRLLSDLPQEERNQAMKYYDDYFADAGENEEQTVIAELGTPEELAKQIKESSSEQIQYGEGVKNHSEDLPQSKNSTESGQNQNNWQQAESSSANTSTARNDTSRTILIIVIAVLTSPIWISLITAFFSVILGLCTAFLGIISAFVLGGGGVAIAGVACIIGGFIACFALEASAGILTIGIGLILTALGSAGCYLGVLFCVKFFPAAFKGLLKFIDWCNIKLRTLF